MSRSRSSNSSDRSRKSNKQSQSNNRQRRRSPSDQGRREEKGQSNFFNNKTDTCLYIGNLDKKCPQEKLKDICEEFGPFEYCYIVFEPTSHLDRNRDTKISRGYAFVKYKNQADAKKALDSLNGMQIMSRKVQVQISRRNRPRESTPGRYLGRRRSPPRRERTYRRRSYSRSSDGDYRRRRKHSSERQRKHRDRDRDHKESKRRDRDRSRSGEKKHRKRRDSRSNSPRK